MKNNYRWEICPVCYSPDIKKIYNLNYIGEKTFGTVKVNVSSVPELWECFCCHSFFAQNIFSEEEAAHLYSSGCSNLRWTDKAFKTRATPITLDVLTKLFKKHEKVLDIGCNTGELLDYSKTFDCKTYGVEISISSRNILEKKGHQAYSRISDVSGSFDLIVAIDLIEHLYSVPDFFKICFGLLSEKGHLVILTGNPHSISAKVTKSKWWYYQYPEHIVFPSCYYYKHVAGVCNCRIFPTYASNDHYSSTCRMISIAIKKIFYSNYGGMPSIGADHHLIVFEKS